MTKRPKTISGKGIKDPRGDHLNKSQFLSIDKSQERPDSGVKDKGKK